MEPILDPEVYSYVQYLGELPIYELFAFGNYAHYIKYSSQFDLQDQQQVVKLLKLTLISIATENENSTVSRQIIDEAEYELGQGLHAVGWDLDKLVISLVDEKLVNIKIDEENGALVIGNAAVLRDAYDGSYALQVLSEQDIPKRSVPRSLETLKQWFETKLVPLKQELHDIKQEKETENSRKRKTPESS